MAITAAMVKDLRERTGAGMMECKKALTEVDGDLDAAAEALRKKGAASADKKAGRIAAEGVITAYLSDDGKVATLVEVNCETDFVAKGDDFAAFSENVAVCVANSNPGDIDQLLDQPLTDSGQTVEEARHALVGKLGENISIRRFAAYSTDGDSILSRYLHGTRIGVLIEVSGGRKDLGHDLAMHIAALKPMCVNEDEVPKDLLAKEREIYSAQAEDSGKPENIVTKIVEGRVQKYLKEITLLGQAFVKDTEQSVAQLLDSEGAKVHRFVRYEVGEGIVRKSDDFVAEVMAQAKGQ